MIKEPIESPEDLQTNLKEYKAIAEEVIQVMKKHGLKQRHVRDVFETVKAVLNSRDI